MFTLGVGISGTSAQLAGAETDCALIDVMTSLHASEATLVERKLAVVAVFARRSSEHVTGVVWTSSVHELVEVEVEVGAVLVYRPGVLSNMGALCRNHHWLKHSGRWVLAPA